MSLEKTSKPSKALVNHVHNMLNNNGWPSSLIPSTSASQNSDYPQSERLQVINRKKDKLFVEMLINNSADLQLKYICLFTEEINCLGEELDEKNKEGYDILIERIHIKNLKICDLLRNTVIKSLTPEEIELLQDAIVSIAEDFVKYLNRNEATLGFSLKKLIKNSETLINIPSLNGDKLLRALELFILAYEGYYDESFLAEVIFLCIGVDCSSDPILSDKKENILEDMQSKFNKIAMAMCSSREAADNKTALSKEIKTRNEEIKRLTDSLARSRNNLELAMRWLNAIMDFAAFLAVHPECSFSDSQEKIAQMERNILTQLAGILQNPQLKKLNAEDSRKIQEGCLYALKKRLNRQMTQSEFEENKRYIAALEGLTKLSHLDLTVMTELSQELQKPTGRFIWPKKEKDVIQKIIKKVSALKTEKPRTSAAIAESLSVSFQDTKGPTNQDVAGMESKSSTSDETSAAQPSEELPSLSISPQTSPKLISEENVLATEAVLTSQRDDSPITEVYNTQENSTPTRKTKIRRDRRGNNKTRGLAPRAEILAESMSSDKEMLREEPVVHPVVLPPLDIDVPAQAIVADTSSLSLESPIPIAARVMPVVSTNFLPEQSLLKESSKKKGLKEKIFSDYQSKSSMATKSAPERSLQPRKKSSIKQVKAILPRGKKEGESQLPVPEISFKHELQHRATQLNQAYQQWMSFQQREAIRYQSFLYNQAARQCISSLSLENMTREEQHMHQKSLTNLEMTSMILELWSVEKQPMLKEQLFQQYQEEYHAFSQWISEQTKGLAVEPSQTSVADVLIDDVWMTYYELRYSTAQNPAVIEDLARLTKMQEDPNILLQEPTWMISALRLELYHQVVFSEALKCYLTQYGAAILQRAMLSQQEALMTELWRVFSAGKAVEFYSLLYHSGYLSILFPTAVKNMNALPFFAETVAQNMQASDSMPAEYRCRSHLFGRILCRAEELQKAPVGRAAFFDAKTDTKEMMPSTSTSYSNGHTVRGPQPQN